MLPQTHPSPQVIKRPVWRSTWKMPTRILYALACIGMLVSTLLGANADNKGNTVQAQQQWVSGSIFLALSLAFAWTTWHVVRLEPQQYSRMFMLRPRTVAGVVVLLFCTFSSRAAFDLAAAAGAVDVSTSGSASVADAAIFIVAYLWWEVVPILVLLTTIAAGRVGLARAPSADGGEGIGVFGAIQAMQAGDGGGMDSDDETALDQNPLVARLLGPGAGAPPLPDSFSPEHGAAQPGRPVSGGLMGDGDRQSAGYEIPAGAVPPHLVGLAATGASLGASTFAAVRAGRTGQSSASGTNSFHDAYEAYLQQQAIMAQTGHSGGAPGAGGVYVGSAGEGRGMLGPDRFTVDSRGGRGTLPHGFSSSGSASNPRLHGGEGVGASGSTSRSFADRHADRVFEDTGRYDTPPAEGQGMRGVAGVGSYSSRGQ